MGSKSWGSNTSLRDVGRDSSICRSLYSQGAGSAFLSGLVVPGRPWDPEPGRGSAGDSRTLFAFLGLTRELRQISFALRFSAIWGLPSLPPPAPSEHFCVPVISVSYRDPHRYHQLSYFLCVCPSPDLVQPNLVSFPVFLLLT